MNISFSAQSINKLYTKLGSFANMYKKNSNQLNSAKN